VEAPQRPTTPAPLVGPEADAEGLSFLTMIADRRFYEPFTVRRLLIGQPALRGDLALTLGRIGDPSSRPVLETLLEDRSAEVRREAAFALGLLGEAADPGALLSATLDEDRRVGRLAVEALARSGMPLSSVVSLLAELDPEEAWRRLLPALFRFDPEAARPLAMEALEHAPSELRSWAVYALARQALPPSAVALRELLGDSDPWVRGWAARALGGIGDGSDLARLRPLLEDAEPGPTIHTLRAARGLVAGGRAAPAGDWLEPLERLLADRRPGVRVTAIEASAVWLRNERLGELLVELARGGSRREREVALLALAEGGDPRARELIAEALRDSDPVIRSRAVEAAAQAGLLAATLRLRDDPEPRVRLAVLGAELIGGGEPAGAAARRALGDGDPALAAAALEWLAGNPVAPIEELREALIEPQSRFLVDVGLNGVAALLARAQAEARERGIIVAILEELARSWDYPVRRRAGRALVELGRPEPARGEFETGRGIKTYRELVRRTREPRRADLVTRHGTIRLEIDCPRAPLTCVNFLQLVNQGFYDGLSFHRVVPDFIVQTGDPRGDGWGGPGYTLRDELGPRAYTRGVVGMALSGPDTGGSQFFIALSAQPHLEGTFTPFGSVELGDEILDLISEGDIIEKAMEVESD
jgi:cyclophilin family peptidyl-prolyl cis-trans isomerase/HEAT repeat protein